MAEVTKPLALDETLQDVAAKLGRISSVAGASAYTQAVAGGYTGTQAEFEAQIAKQPIVVNPNLVDNWYFIGGGSQQGAGQFPINQRGQTVYSGNGAWAIDRWCTRKSSGSNSQTAVTSDGLVVSDSAGTSLGGLNFPIENKLAIAGNTVTISGLFKNVSIAATGSYASLGLYNAPSKHAHSQAIGRVSITSDGLFTATFPVTAEQVNQYDYLNFGISESGTVSLTIQAVKLELGDTQTLAHNEGTEENPVWVLNEIPNYTEELWKCQRYYQLFASSSYRPTYGEDYRPPMRLHSPTKGTISIGGTTYYYADAQL